VSDSNRRIMATDSSRDAVSDSAPSSSSGSMAASARPLRNRSLRFRLLAMHAVVLLGTAALAGVMLFRSLEMAVRQSVDIQLSQLAEQLSSVVEPLPDGVFLIELTDQLSEAFAHREPDSGYYCLWDQEGDLIDASHPDLQMDSPGSSGARDREQFREVSVSGPGGSLILCGRSVAPELVRLREVAGRFTATAAVIITGLLGAGWFLTQRALSPIRRIADAAAAVSLSNLSQRIDVDSMEYELAELATTINSTFDRLQRSFDQQSRFRAHASHELRTPLAIILANVDLALRRVRTPEEYQETLTTISKSANRMKTIVEGLLSLAQAESGQLRVESQPVSLREVVESTCVLMQPLAEKKGMQIQFHGPACESCDFVMGDADRLTEAVTNLVSNAVHYGDEGTEVSVRLDCTHDAARIHVRSFGPPVPEADRNFLFTPFYRVEGSQQRHANGCGLGLAITYWIVGAHGGSTSFQSTESDGTVFTIELPLTAPATRTDFSRSTDSME